MDTPWIGWGTRIRAAREAAGLTQVELAAAVGVNQSTVSSWERGLFPTSDTRKPAVARALDESEAALFQWPPHLEPVLAATGRRKKVL